MKIIARLFGILFGFMMVIWGLMVMFLNDTSTATLLWMLSINFIIASIGSIFTYGEKKDLGLVDKWTLLSSGISFAFGIVLVNSNFIQVFEFNILNYMLGTWLIAMCVTRIGKSVFVYKVNRALNKKTPSSKRWWVILAIGVVFGILGILSFVSSLITIFSSGILLGISLLIAGADLLMSQFEE